MKKYGGVDIYTHIFLTSVLIEEDGQLNEPAALPPEKESPEPIG
jgi:hypothetical protein